MTTTIHPTAIVAPTAQLGSGVVIEAYAYIGARAKIGDGTVVMHHATVDGNTTLGRANKIHPYAYIGGMTQDLKYKGGDPELIIGDNNNFREYATVHCGTTEEIPTRIGSHNHFLSYSHVAHDCMVGSHCVFSNAVQLAGHVVVEDHVVFGGLGGAHQFVRIGQYAMIGGASAVIKDVPPYMMAAGNHATAIGINKVGLERNGFSQDEIEDVFRAYKIIFRRGHTFANIPEHLRNNLSNREGRICQNLAKFLEESKRGVVAGGRS